MYPGAPPTLAGVDNDCNGYILGLEQLGERPATSTATICEHP